MIERKDCSNTEVNEMSLTEQKYDVEKIIRPATKEKLAITILAGGPSGEREVSLESGKTVAAALETLGHDIHLADISPDNLAALARNVDCVFVALHGTFGEDGQVQTILEKRGLAYTGSAPAVCALAMDKKASKEEFIKAGLPTPRYTIATRDTIREAMVAWSLPVFVKPVKEGSSLHCYLVRDVSQFRPAIEQVLSKYEDCLIEQYIPGMEVTVGILGDTALPPIEIRTRRPFYDYAAKYIDDDTQYCFDFDLPQKLLEELTEMSLRAHQTLGCRDFSRVDWRVNPLDGKAYILEVNVIPGLTSHSLLPKAAHRAGINLPQACQHIIDLAMKRHFSR